MTSVTPCSSQPIVKFPSCLPRPLLPHQTARYYWKSAAQGHSRQGRFVRLALVSMLARGHLLIEGVPGVGKTTLGQALARALDCSFQRVQFTSDMLPSDVVGISIYSAVEQQFEFKHGPVFTNVLLADEINRTTPKTQSALLEAMNEGQVTVDAHSYTLPQPFWSLPRRIPVEHHGLILCPSHNSTAF